ncbi:energy-coupling factor transporter transmembrane component T family protein [Lysinimonas soli]|uniref:Energy-coupling factor transporter transmembrane component T family protein n=1 Tax=Lysinimonas soli TaxID=1074233 RepID=A0ABW0NNI8_9MICO
MISLYRPGRSLLHRAPAGAKLLGLVILGLAVSFIPRDRTALTVVLLAAAALLVVAGYASARLAPGILLRQLWTTRWIVVVMVVTQLIFLTPWDAAVSTVRVVAILLLAALLTLTTRSEDLLDALQTALRPLTRFGVDPRRVGLTLSLTIAMLPVIASIAERVREAQQARGARLGVRAIVPMLVLSLRHADDVADALTARGVE